MAKKKTTKPYPIYPGYGVLTRDDAPNYTQAVTGVTQTDDTLSVSMPGLSPVIYPSTNITTDPNTGRLSFISSNTPYRVRELSEDDGSWLSSYKTFLPQTALEALMGPIDLGDADPMATPDINLDMPPETLDAFAFDDSVYIVGLLYTNTSGRYSRQDGDWMLLSPDDDTFQNPQMVAIEINPPSANQFIQMYDQNYVTVTDAEQYENPASAALTQAALQALAPTPDTTPAGLLPAPVQAQPSAPATPVQAPTPTPAPDVQ